MKKEEFNASIVKLKKSRISQKTVVKLKTTIKSQKQSLKYLYQRLDVKNKHLEKNKVAEHSFN